MKRIILSIIILLLLATGAFLLFHKSPKPLPPVVRKPAAVQITHGVKPPYNDCLPNETGSVERKHQQEIIDTTKAMQQEEKTTAGQISPGLTALNQKYNDLITQYDTCTMITN